MSAKNSFNAGLARRYAKALYDVAREKNILEAVASDIKDFQTLLTETPALCRALSGAGADKRAKIEILKAVAQKAGYAEIFSKFLIVAAGNGRCDGLLRICAEFLTLFISKQGKKEITVTSAAPLSTEDEAQIITAIKEKFGFEPLAVKVTDKSLIGGFTVKVGDLLIDTGMKTQLRNLFKAMRGVA